ncbi:MAG TPA: fimbrial protein [Paraburkholderia sp.]|uniref:fimbrial protein n=1 Tax=Paraburkholderia sp. TaxID=1926495 RepID=UPI002B45BCBD|nr:fimbrial protein [Paraburkholderia sp.]HKR47065.1 fimbrial protein [Paraburkholderia sp.]
MKAIRFLIAALLLLAAHGVWAQCTGNGVVTTVALPASLAVTRDMQPGTVVYDSGWAGSQSAYVNCKSGTNDWGYVSPMTSAGRPGVYETGVPGIGILIAWSNTLTIQPSDVNAATVLQWPRVSATLPNGNLVYLPAALYRVQLVVTGQVASGTMTLPTPTVSSSYGGIMTTSTTFTNTTIQVKQTGCRVLDSNIVVPLPKVSAASFHGAGSTLGATAFQIPLSCDAGVKVAYEIDGTADPAGPGVLANQTGPGLARGVGVQIQQGGTPIALNALSSTYVTTASAAQAVNIPFTARYYATGVALTPGLISAVATFTMNYQ